MFTHTVGENFKCVYDKFKCYEKGLAVVLNDKKNTKADLYVRS